MYSRIITPVTAILGMALAMSLTSCTGSEPSEGDMKDAMLQEMNRPEGNTPVIPISIQSFKKEACNKPNEQGYHCTFEALVQSTNIGASMYNNVRAGDFYKDSAGKWAMRPPF